MDKPYAHGFNGHARCCDCGKCAASRAEAVASRWEENGKFAMPKTLDSTVFVNSHFRRAPNHLKNFPATRKLMRNLLKLIKTKT